MSRFRSNLDPPRLRRALGHLVQATDPTPADHQAERRHAQRGVWVTPTWEGRVALQGLLDPEAGQTPTAALGPWPARPAPPMPAAATSAAPMPWPSWPAATWRAASCPRAAGSAPTSTSWWIWASLLGHPGAIGREGGGAGP